MATTAPWASWSVLDAWDQHLQPVRGLGEVVKLQGDQLGALAHQHELEHQSDAVAQLDHLLCGVLLLPAGPLGALACR